MHNDANLTPHSKEDIWADKSHHIYNNLPFWDIDLESKELIIFPDNKTFSFPYNLIKNKTGLLSKSISICAPLNFQTYINYKTQLIDSSFLLLWAPIKEEDLAVNITYSTVKEELLQLEYTDLVFCEDTVPDKNLFREINILIAHGGKDSLFGFQALSPSDDKVYLNDDLLGNGKIAILFICHSGNLTKKVYENNIHGLVNSLLDNERYQTVIAPFWSLNIMIPHVWVLSFLKSFRKKHSVSQCVYQANKSIQQKYPVESAWAAMHLFGNPHIECK